MLRHLIPTPKTVVRSFGTHSLGKDTKIVLSFGCDVRLFKASVRLAEDIFEETRAKPLVTKVLGTPALDGCVNVIADENGSGEGYRLTVCRESVTVEGESPAGAFYGIQTLRQLIRESSGTLPCLVIEDKPDMAHRGFYQDISRGRVPTVASTKKLIDMLSYYKQNSLQFYIEHTFPFDEYAGICRADNSVTPEEIVELDEYCWEHFIDFVPSLSTFGHLYRLLDDPRWHEYCELDKYEPFSNDWHNAMAHHTIDPSNPGSIHIIRSMIDQYLPLFRSNYFNICCDETFDLGKGRNAGKDSGKLYLEFTKQIIAHVQSRGKTVMMWGDIVLNHPEVLKNLPKSVVMLNWGYSPEPNVGNAVKFREAGYRQILCPGTSCWNNWSEHIGVAERNIVAMIRSGHENGALGSLNTAWGDYGHTASMNTTLYGIVLAAAYSWNKDEKVMCAQFDRRVSEMVYGDPSGRVVALLRALGDTYSVMNWGYYANQHFRCQTWMRPTTDLRSLYGAAKTALGIAEQFRKLPVKNEIIDDLILAAEGEYLICMSSARISGGRRKTPDGFTEDWCKRYADSWRRNDKESELWRILDVMYHAD
ncbi:MAG: family 20 glycosylhydrolase [Clostridia bacterium]|nr:family 20 glycosylhydrolase [Clostridia bacterium]